MKTGPCACLLIYIMTSSKIVSVVVIVVVVVMDPGIKVVIVITRVDADGATDRVISFCSQRQWLDISEMEIQNIAKSVQIYNLRFVEAYFGI